MLIVGFVFQSRILQTVGRQMRQTAQAACVSIAGFSNGCP
jgi:hypothetical protein